MVKKHKAIPIIVGDMMKQQERFEKLYGSGDYSATITKNTKNTMRLIVVFSIILFLLLIIQILKSNLPTKGVTLDHNGNIVSISRPSSDDATVVFDADIISDSGSALTGKSIKLMISPLQTEAQQKSQASKKTTLSQEDTTQHEIRKALYQLNSDTTIQTVKLPNMLEDGTRIHWVPKKSNNGWMIPFLLAAGGYVIYNRRDSGLVKAEKAARESVLRELPEFVNTLVLLLNAGLVISNAFYKIVSDYEKIRGGDNNYFYGQLSRIVFKCSHTNGSIQHEIRNFAVRTGVVEFMRLSNIINDSVTKGSDLMIQLKMEGDSLWVARRKQIEEKGKLAETKLTLPLVILLLVLLMITISPAMMEM